jgi:hypothetical protein
MTLERLDLSPPSRQVAPNQANRGPAAPRMADGGARSAGGCRSALGAMRAEAALEKELRLGGEPLVKPDDGLDHLDGLPVTVPVVEPLRELEESEGATAEHEPSSRLQVWIKPGVDACPGLDGLTVAANTVEALDLLDHGTADVPHDRPVRLFKIRLFKERGPSGTRRHTRLVRYPRCVPAGSGVVFDGIAHSAGSGHGDDRLHVTRVNTVQHTVTWRRIVLARSLWESTPPTWKPK